MSVDASLILLQLELPRVWASYEPRSLEYRLFEIISVHLINISCAFKARSGRALDAAQISLFGTTIRQSEVK